MLLSGGACFSQRSPPLDVIIGRSGRGYPRRRSAPRTLGREWDITVGNIIRDLTEVRVALVDELPAECGGGVSIPVDGLIWILLERSGACCQGEPIDLAEWVDKGYELHALGEPVTVTDQARRFGTDLDTARRALWAVAWEWWELERLART